jgi:hypothetical protein
MRDWDLPFRMMTMKDMSTESEDDEILGESKVPIQEQFRQYAMRNLASRRYDDESFDEYRKRRRLNKQMVKVMKGGRPLKDKKEYDEE